MHFLLTAISGKKYDAEVYEVVLPTMDGRIGVLAHHMPLFSVIVPGVIAIRKTARDPDSSLEYFATYGGAIEVSNNSLKVLVDEAHQPDEINEAEAREAMERAEKMKAEAKDQTSLEQAQSLVDRQAVRLQVASLKRHHR
jgi:F-type H+-transporting ATPase subunit epsilon